jgi:hypothetical protein
MIKVKEKYIGGFKHKGVQYNLDGYSQEKLESIYKGELSQFLEKEEKPVKVKELCEKCEEGECICYEDKLIKPKKNK